MSADDDSSFFPRYLKNINQAIANCLDQGDLNVLLAKKAGYLARHSLAEQAKSIISDLRKRNQTYDPRLTGWTVLSEGLALHYEYLDNLGSKGKFSRALMTGKVAKDTNLTSIAAAWLANSEYALNEINSAVDHLEQSFRLSNSENGDARGRAMLLLGDMLYWCGKPKSARHWYRESRKYAVHDGDIAMQNIIFFNTANYAVWALTLQDCRAPLASESWRHVALEVASAKNLNFALGIENLPSLIPTMEAELKVVQRSWHQSENIFCETIHNLGDEGQQRSISKMFAQRAWCRVNLGNMDGAKSDIADALLQISDCGDLDDLLVLHSRISQSAVLIGDADMANRHQRISRECEQLFSNQQEKIYGSIVPILDYLASETKNPA